MEKEEMNLTIVRIQETINALKQDISRLEGNLGDLKAIYRKDVTENVNLWNSAVENQKWITRIVLGSVITGAIALFGFGIK